MLTSKASMKQHIFSLTFFLFSCFALLGQGKFENSQFGFSMAEPENWTQADNDDLLKNLSKIDLKEEDLKKLISDHNGSLLLTSFYKYNLSTHAGLIPTIQVNVRKNDTRNFNEFTSLITQSANSFKQYFPDFSFETAPKVVEIGGIKSIYFVGKFSMQTANGESLKVRSRTYAIPHGNYFFQLNFTDGQITEDNSDLFDALAKTVRIGRS
ncbi:hypothetical protein [Salinimicrobium sp. TH3]|uniref:hypothetical protein n=1 Tax=Salinimicrobium sp. TH3 TaxID=2997342 RepID=UPI00227462A2|nr:hypothetical protein [Salinimicrobium sp. TH3]MCY2688586.1 hypothetical protein [Salinimicrobium sp. TH3]